MANEIRRTYKTSGQFALGYALSELEIGIETDTDRIKVGPGNWVSLPYVADGTPDMTAVIVALLAHLQQTDPHGDRAYADGIAGGGGGTTASLLDTDTINTSVGKITSLDLQNDLVTDAAVSVLPSVAGVITAASANTAALAGLSNQSTIMASHLRTAAVANTTTAVVDLYPAVVRPFIEGDRAIYVGDQLFVNQSGSDITIALLFKIAGNNNFTGVVTLPSTAASTSYLSSFYVEAVMGNTDLLHFHSASWKVRTANPNNSNATPSSALLADLSWWNDSTSVSWVQTQVPSVEPRWSMSVANAACSVTRLGSAYILNKKP